MDPAIISLIIMAICIVLFVIDKIPTSVVAILGCVAMAIFVDGCGTTAFSGFSNEIILLLIGMFIVSDALLKSGAATIIGRFVNKLAHGHEKLLVAILMIATIVISSFVGNSATVPMMLTVVYGIVVADKENKYNFMNLALPVGIAGVLGSSTTLIASTPQLTAVSLLENAVNSAVEAGTISAEAAASMSLGMFTFSLPGLIIAAIGVVFVVFVCYPLGKKIWGKRDPVAAKANLVAPEEIDLTDKGNKYRLYMSFGILGLMIVLFVLSAFIDQLGVGAVSLLCGMLCILLKVTTFKEAYSSLNWNVILWLAGCIGLGACLNTSGAADLIANAVVDILGDVSPFVFFAVIVLLAMVMSNFIANITTVVILVPLVLPMGISMGINPMALCVGIVFGANFALLTPLANAFIGLTSSAGYKFKDYILYGGLPQILCYILTIVFVPLFFSLSL